MKGAHEIHTEDIKTTPKSSKSVVNHVTPTGNTLHQAKIRTPVNFKELMATTPAQQSNFDILKPSIPMQGNQVKSSTPLQVKHDQLKTSTPIQSNQQLVRSKPMNKEQTTAIEAMEDESLDDLDFTEDFDDDNIMPELNTDTPTSHRWGFF